MKKILLAFFVVAISFAHEKPKTPASFQVKPFAESSYYIGKNLNGTEIKDSAAAKRPERRQERYCGDSCRRRWRGSCAFCG